MENHISSSSNDISDKTVISCPLVVEACNKFADERMALSADLYKSRGELNTDKIRKDIITGALAEFAVYNYLKSKGYECSKPDLTIYIAAQKSFAPDLTADGKVLHVKSQTTESASKYSSSWLFQKTDKVLGTPSETALMAFCLVEGITVHIKAIVKVLDIIENDLVKEPKVFRYKFSKNALYLDDILKSKLELWRL